jgi:hypothetical protein|tara:strand:+ start:1485 stop:2948 length:1464 start_codon:yes stop_codon:yes gene_type:complete
MSIRIDLFLIVAVPVFFCGCSSERVDLASTDTVTIEERTQQENDLREWNNRIRREKFDIVLPEVMRSNDVDMWIHVMRETIPDPFGAEDLGSTSGVFVFTDRGGDRIERAVLGRRWGASHAAETWRVTWETKLVEESGAYDILHDPILVKQPPGGPETEYDYRFQGLREFVEAREPERIALNFKLDLGPYPTTTRAQDGLSYTDYLLLAEELGEQYANRIVSSEFVMMEYIATPVPSEIELLKKMREDEVERITSAFEEIVPGVTRNRDVGMTVFRRRGTGVSQRGRTPGHENVVIEGGDIIAAPSQGMYAYVLRDGETEPPPGINELWATYRRIDEILAEHVKVGLTPREIVNNYTAVFEEEGIILRDNQLHLFTPRNDFLAYTAGFDSEKTHLNIDLHAMAKGARERKFENYFGPRIGSNGPEWMWDIPLPLNHHFVLEYFIYMPWPSSEHENQYLFWWDHEQAIATNSGVEYLSAPQEELYLIK